MLKAWTVQRAAMAGVAAGLGALLLAASPGPWPDWLLFAYAGLLGLTCLCGLSILWITMIDMRSRGRGGRMRAIRAFDIAIALALLLPAAYALSMIGPEL